MSPRRLIARLLALVVLLVVLVAGWGAFRAWQAYSALAAARADASRAQTALTNGKTSEAVADARQLGVHTRKARQAVDDPVWGLAGHLPAVGADAAAVRALARDLDAASTQVITPLAGVADALRPSSLRRSGNTLDVQTLQRAAPTISQAAAAATQINSSLQGIDTANLAGALARQIEAVQKQWAELTAQVREAGIAARTIPSMLGADTPRTYLLAFQNLAEARGTGGLLGAYGLLQADHGRLTLSHLGSNTELRNADAVPVDLGRDFTRLYGEDPAWWVNSNMSPNFPYAAQIWLALWQRQHHQKLDGVIAVDPVALGYVLGATGPAPLPDGGQLTAANAADVTMRAVYAKFPGLTGAENAVRDLYLSEVARAAFGQITSGKGDARALATALGKAAGEHRLLVYSAHASEQRELEATPLAGVLPDQPGPFVAVVVNNGGGNKLDYYLRRDVTYQQVGCAVGERHTRVTVRLSSSAPTTGLPAYVTVRADAGARQARPRVGTNLSLVNVYAARGAQLTGARIDGETALVQVGYERGHPVFALSLETPPGQTHTVTLDLIEPTDGADNAGSAGSSGEPTTPFVWQQPAARPGKVSVSFPSCGFSNN